MLVKVEIIKTKILIISMSKFIDYNLAEFNLYLFNYTKEIP